ncbi:MAG: hypothetical protein PHI37_03420 [Candidatus Gracilibacteria bacterium]|nr:hypothetical protein [Candidatus Gracilibacteria bacterium]
MGNDVFIKNVESKDLGESELLAISQVQKDMWAYSLGEYVRCNCCNHIHSKNDIFGHLSSEIRLQSVTSLEEIFLGDSIKCMKCDSGNTEFIYDIDKSISYFREKYKQEAFLVLGYDYNGDIIGFMDGYFAHLIDIYNLEISFHYPNLSVDVLEEIIKNKLNISVLGKMLSLSSIGTYETYISYPFIYELIRKFFKLVSDKKGIPGIIELDKKNSIYLIYKIMGSLSLGIDSSLVENVNEDYQSDLCIFTDPIDNFNTNFDMSFRQFVKRHKIK